ncbi:MAG TPA: CcdB family protein [Povalibacter sp.]|uniref:CcdB family protein n=1 Tax=Povalibacter sp. TaxID=1962978 RepID=UPI002BF35227|nr:CcdB family protein [Povalibacter sp.]HMN43540.1 CcdB family protein [Povalibacter sp.]
MAQFDVHRNLGNQRDSIPFVVVVQSSLYDDYGRRIVVPLVKTALLGKVASRRFNPEFRIKNLSVTLHPLEIASVPVGKLGERIGSLADEADRIIGALDELLTRVGG